MLCGPCPTSARILKRTWCMMASRRRCHGCGQVFVKNLYINHSCQPGRVYFESDRTQEDRNQKTKDDNKPGDTHQGATPGNLAKPTASLAATLEEFLVFQSPREVGIDRSHPLITSPDSPGNEVVSSATDLKKQIECLQRQLKESYSQRTTFIMDTLAICNGATPPEAPCGGAIGGIGGTSAVGVPVAECGSSTSSIQRHNTPDDSVSRSTLEQLQKELHVKWNNDCPICKRPMTVLLGCKHVFCYCCITEWSTRSNKCPLCRRKFRVPADMKDQVQSGGAIGGTNELLDLGEEELQEGDLC